MQMNSGGNNIPASAGVFTGEDQSFRWTIWDQDPLTETSPPTAKNITGWTIQYKMSATLGGAAVITKTAVLTTPLSGICTVSIASTDWASAPAGTYFFNLSRTDSGQNQVLDWGTIVVNARAA